MDPTTPNHFFLRLSRSKAARNQPPGPGALTPTPTPRRRVGVSPRRQDRPSDRLEQGYLKVAQWVAAGH